MSIQLEELIRTHNILTLPDNKGTILTVVCFNNIKGVIMDVNYYYEPLNGSLADTKWFTDYNELLEYLKTI